MKQDIFENKIKQILDEAKIEPSDDVWNNILRKLLIRTTIKYTILILVSSAMISAIVYLSMFRKSIDNIQKPLNTQYISPVSTYDTVLITNNINHSQFSQKNQFVANKNNENPISFTIDSYTDNYIKNQYKVSSWNITNNRNDDVIVVENKNNQVVFTNDNNNIIEKNESKLTANFDFNSPVYAKKITQFYINTKGVYKYEWLVNYEFKSKDSIFEYVFPRADLYVVSLVVFDKSGKSDTITKSVVAIEPDKSIVFPNAICPNVSGSSGGYYNENIADNSIFRPFVYGKTVTTYKLTILNRNGTIIYTSNDFYKGWDGYSNNKLVPIGVYLFIAEGKFSDGQSFKEYGSITVLY